MGSESKHENALTGSWEDPDRNAISGIQQLETVLFILNESETAKVELLKQLLLLRRRC